MIRKKPKLIDKIVADNKNRGTLQQASDGEWYIAKPLSMFTFQRLLIKVYHCCLLLAGKAEACQYAQDRSLIKKRG